jgi:hypothetical protein
MADEYTLLALGTLIARLNPYTNLPLDSAGHQTGEMQLKELSPAAGGSSDDPVQDIISRTDIEVESGYDSTWNFKGVPQNLKGAARIPYRFAVKDKDGKILYWQTEHLLIGFAGAEGGG